MVGSEENFWLLAETRGTEIDRRLGASEMAKWLKVLVAKPDTHTEERERPLHKLSSDLTPQHGRAISTRNKI